jgi:glycerol-1-phosphate dehydrogenase [NAD(P)+]
MLTVSSSRPASGAEHQFSHFWEMKMLREGRKAIFHGTKVGVASVFVASYYRLIRQLSLEELEQRLEQAALPDWKQVEAGIRSAYGQIADEIIASQAKYQNMTEEAFRAYKQRIRTRWADVQAVAASVPEPETITELLGKVGGARTPEEAGLTKDDVEQAFVYARYVRSAYSVLRLCETLQLAPDWVREPGE